VTVKIGHIGFVLLPLLLSACVSVEKVASGPRNVGERMTVTIEGPWNNINLPRSPAQHWTMEGLPVDQLMLYSGLKDDGLLHAELAGEAEAKSFRFRSSMAPDEIVSAIEGMLTRDGSGFTLTRLEPANFGGHKGFRFEFQLVRKTTNLYLKGIGYGAVSKGELFAMIYSAPRLAFFDRHIATVEKVGASARIRE
jgi:hypothetical protein